MPPTNNWVRKESDIFDNGIGKYLSFNTTTKPSSYQKNDSDISKLIRSNGIYNKYAMDWTSKFARNGIIDPYNALLNTKEYIFITKPDLCIAKNIGTSRIKSLAVSDTIGSNNMFFVDAVARYPDMVKQLEQYVSADEGPFMNVLSNSVKSSLSIPGISSDHIESAANIMGTKISYRGTSYKSDEEFDFTLEFQDTKYLDIYMLFKMYEEYEKLKWNGLLEFKSSTLEGTHWLDYMMNKILHDQVSIYKFIVAEDGYRIVYWARITGCFPNSVPRDAFSNMDNDGGQLISVGWRGHFVRDMDPVILYQFNQLVQNQLSTHPKDLPLYDTSINATNGTWASVPYIYMRNENISGRGTMKQYYLRWRE